MRQPHTSTRTRVNYSDAMNIEAVIETLKRDWIYKYVEKHHPEIVKKAESIKQKCMDSLNISQND